MTLPSHLYWFVEEVVDFDVAACEAFCKISLL